MRVYLVFVTMGLLVGFGPAAAEKSVSFGRDGAAAAQADERTDRYGDPLPLGAVARCGTVRFRQGEAISCLAWSPDSCFIASGSAGAIRLWEARTGKLLRSLPGHGTAHGGGTWSLAFSPDGKKLLSIGSDRKVRAYQVTTGKTILESSLSEGLATAPYLAGGQLVAFHGGAGVVALPDGHRDVIMKDEGKGRLGNRRPFQKPRERVLSLTLSGDGARRATVCVGGRIDPAKRARHVFIKVENIVSGKTFSTGDVKSRTIALSGNGKLLAAGEVDGSDGRVLLFDGDSGKPLGELTGHKRGVRLVALSSDGRLVASWGGDITLRVWDSRKRTQVWQSPIPRKTDSRSMSISSLAFSPDSRMLAVVGSDGIVDIWSVATGKLQTADQGHYTRASSVVFAPDGTTLASGSLDGTIRLWNASTGKQIRRINVPSGSVWDVAFSPDGKTLVSAGVGGIHVWDIGSGKKIYSLGDNVSLWFTVTFSKDGKKLIGKGNGPITVWNTADRRKPASDWKNSKLGLGADSVIAPDASLMACVHYNMDAMLGAFVAPPEPRLSLFDLASGEVRGEFGGCHVPFCFSPQVDLLVCKGANSVKLLELCSGLTVLNVPYRWEKTIGVSSVAWIKRTARMAFGEADGSICIHDAITGHKLRRFLGHQGEVCDVALSPDGKLMASVSADSTVLVWRMVEVPLRTKTVKTATRSMDAFWKDLASKQGATAYQAMWGMAAAGNDAADFLARMVLPVKKPDAKRIGQLIRDLNSDQYAIRTKASSELGTHGMTIVEEIQEALKTNRSPEAKGRLKALLAGAQNPFVREPSLLRKLRSVSVLERIDSERSLNVLERLAGGAPNARLTRGASAALQRLQSTGKTPATLPAATQPGVLPPKTASDVLAKMAEARRLLRSATYKIERWVHFVNDMRTEDVRPPEKGALVVAAGTRVLNKERFVVSGAKYRHDTDGIVPLVSGTGGLVPFRRFMAYDGKIGRTHNVIRGSGSLRRKPWTRRPLSLTPLVHFHWGLYTMSKGFRVDALKLVGKRNWKGRPCYVLAEEVGPMRMEYYVDPQYDWALVSLSMKIVAPDKRVFWNDATMSWHMVPMNEYELEITYKKDSCGLWLPAGWVVRTHKGWGKDRKPRRFHTARVKKAKGNVNVPDSTFAIRFPDGTRVRDEDRGVSVKWDNSLSWKELDARFQRKADKIEQRKLERRLRIESKLKVGDAAPLFESRTIDGKRVRLADLRGKYVLLAFWAGACRTPRRETPFLKAAYERGRKDPRFAMVIVANNNEKVVKHTTEWVAKNKVKWDVTFMEDRLNGELQAKYGRSHVGWIFLIGPDGKVIARNLRGPAIKAAVEKVLRATPPATQPAGELEAAIRDLSAEGHGSKRRGHLVDRFRFQMYQKLYQQNERSEPRSEHKPL